MIKVSTRGDYGTVLMTYLARNYRRELVPLSEIAKREKLSFSYLQKLAGELKRAGLLITKEGIDGGIQLSRNPSKISIGEIVRVLEGPMELVRCGSCKISSFCPSQKPWQKVFKIMTLELNKISLKDILDG
jgi:Rrf2 family transcriptional regulator, cysteine metabolism repressor